VSADYSQIELRIMAHLSTIRLLTALPRTATSTRYRRKSSRAAAEVSNDRGAWPGHQLRPIYGMSAFGLPASSIWSVPRAAYIDRYFARYPGVADYMQRTREAARSQATSRRVRRASTCPKSTQNPQRARAPSAPHQCADAGTAATHQAGDDRGTAWLDDE